MTRTSVYKQHSLLIRKDVGTKGNLKESNKSNAFALVDYHAAAEALSNLPAKQMVVVLPSLPQVLFLFKTID